MTLNPQNKPKVPPIAAIKSTPCRIWRLRNLSVFNLFINDLKAGKTFNIGIKRQRNVTK